MLRKRMINPEIWEDEHFGHLSDKSKILFIACISGADDEGRLSANPNNLRALAFRFEDITINKVLEIRNEVASKMKNFSLYSVNNLEYIQFLKWEKHQILRNDRLKPSKLPSPIEGIECPSDSDGMSDNPSHKLSEVKLRVTKKNNHKDVILILWNKFCDKHQSLSKIQALNKFRNDHLKTRLNEKLFNFSEILKAIEEQPFLINGNPKSESHKNWKVTFDWIIKNDSNYIKILERQYKNDKESNIPEHLRGIVV